jgi:PAS domain S-box-containing protein
MGGRESRGTRELRGELAELRRRKAELEASENRYRRLVEELSRGEDLFRSMTDTANDAIIALDAQGIVIYMNRAGERLFGRSAEEVLGRPLHEILVPERFRDYSSEAFAARAAAGMDGMLGTVREFLALSKDGREFPVEVSISAARSGERTCYITFCRDITRRKQTEEDLRESQQRYRDLIENLNDVVFTLDLLGRFTYISPTIERMSHYTADDIIGRPFAHFVHPDDLQGLLEEFERTLGGDLEPHEFRVLDKDGTIVHVRTSSRPLFRNGELAGLAGLMTDISRHKQAEEELESYRGNLEDLVEERTRELEGATERLRHSERYFRALIENAYDIIAVLNREGRMDYLSPSLEKLSGFTQEERLGEDAFKFFHPEDLPGVMEAFTRGLLQPGYTDMVEYRWQHKDGSWHWQEAVATNMLEDPVVHGIVVNARDITDRKRAEERLRKLNECFLSLGTDPLENIRRFVMTGKDILEANMARYGRLDKGDFHIFSSHHADEGFQRMEKAGGYLCYHLMSRGGAGPVTRKEIANHVFDKDSDVCEHCFSSFLFYPIEVQGEVVGCFTLFDKEDRAYSRMEMDTMAMLARAIGIEEERHAFNESLRDFVDVASHELRHPVALLAGYTETLESHGPEMDELTRQEIVDAIILSAERISSMVMGLVNASLVERERFHVSTRRVEIAPLVEQVVREMRVKAPGWGFFTEVSRGAGECEADPERIHDVLVVLMDNAVKYSPEGSDVEVRVEGAGREVTISVLDRGTGVPVEHGDRIFERFFQVEEAQYHSKPGLGLGLFLARQVVEAHGGRIWYEPRAGGGSIFRFTLPGVKSS